MRPFDMDPLTRRPRRSAILACALAFCLAGWPAGALGIILHPDGEPNLATWVDRPSTAVLGRWGSNASCVVVSPNCVVTTRHQGGSATAAVVVDGRTYAVERTWDHPQADLRVARLTGALFNDFVDLYSALDEVGRTVVIAGCGVPRDATLTSGGLTYGYSWAQTTNTTLRMGTNQIDAAGADEPSRPLASELLTADFDRPGRRVGTTYECTLARYDSGGGWFIKLAGQWRLAGLSRGVESHYEPGHEDDPAYLLAESWFRNREQPQQADPDYFDAVRIGPYADWIRLVLGSPIPGDLNEDLWVDMTDAAILGGFWGRRDCAAPDWCGRADFEPDGDVDFDDLAWLAVHWLGPDFQP